MLIEGINVSIPDRLFEGLEAFGDAPCLIDTSGTTLSYAQAIAQADGLFARPELPDGGLAFVFAPSTVLGVLAYIGAVRKGYAVHLLDPNKRAAADQLVETFDPDIIVDPGRTDPVQVRSAQVSALHADIRILLSTSGSTGSSKLVKLSDRNICSNTASIIQYLGLTSEDRGITLLKLFYSYGMSVVNIHLHAGASLVVTEDGIDNPDFWLLLEREKVTNLSGVPFSFEFIRQSGRDVTRHRSLRLLTQAGGKLAAKHVQAFAGLRAQGGPDFFVMYGQTEAAPRISYLHPETAAKVPGSIGRAIPGGRLSLAEETGAEITETGVSGELIYEGPNVMVGYAQSRADLTFVEDIPRLATGDIAHMDSDGLFHIDGRSARFVKPFGLRISLDEVEERL
ncbi:MAG: AMP-binding protein, partial [Pseudomonadota bacterium]